MNFTGENLTCVFIGSFIQEELMNINFKPISDGWEEKEKSPNFKFHDPVQDTDQNNFKDLFSKSRQTVAEQVLQR